MDATSRISEIKAKIAELRARLPKHSPPPLMLFELQDLEDELQRLQTLDAACTMKESLPTRWVHLDFHTSEEIAGIGSAFDANEFADTLERARVNSITCFARCHHGWMYFDTQAFPERRHPHLTRNLLKEQIEACHKRGIRVPIYTTVQWDHFTARQHPEWLVLDENGSPRGTKLYDAGFYRELCINSPYRDFLKAHIREILETLPTDGLFLDIVRAMDCSCRYCREGMLAKGLEPSDAESRRVYGQWVLDDFRRDMSAFIRSINPDCSIFYNEGHIGPAHRRAVNAYSHFELESLPSGGWGYTHFPLTVRYARTLGLECIGQTGKFHTSWGDFHSFKNEEALQFECFRMLALGAKCGVGDQLHPNGKISQPVYDLIGSVYREVEKREAWCVSAEPLADIGVITPEAFVAGRQPAAAVGALRMLQEAGHQFDVIDAESDLSAYRVLILPDNIPAGPVLAAKIEAYLAKGGAVLASYQSGLNEEKTAFNLPSLGVSLKGPAPFSPDFIIPRGDIGKGLPETEHVMYLQGMEVVAEAGTEVLAEVAVPYFNRTYKHFCSHRHTPSSGKVGYPGIVKKGKAIYFAHPVFTQYNQNGPRWCKRLVLNALEMLLPQPLLRHQGPSSLFATVNAQDCDERWVLHLLHYIPERRSQDMDIIEDVIPLHELHVSLRAKGRVESVACVPEMMPLAFTEKAGRVEFVVPKVVGYQMVAITWKG